MGLSLGEAIATDYALELDRVAIMSGNGEQAPKAASGLAAEIAET